MPAALPPGTTSTFPLPAPRVGVPAGLFAPHRRPAFTLLDTIGDPAEVDHAWLEECAGEVVYVLPRDAAAFRSYLCLHLPDILATGEVPLVDRAWAAHRALLHELAFLFAGAGHGRANALMDACRALAGFMRAHFAPDALFHSLRAAAPYTPVVHGVETAIDSLAVAIADGQRALEALATLACGAAVADAGLLDLPREIRDRSAALTPMKWKVIPRHPDLSLRRMHAYGIVAPEAQRAVRHHHERWDGEGYPGRLGGEAIPIEARYVAIADTYSVLTVARRGMPRLSRGDALREMARSSGQFDPALLRILVRLLAGDAGTSAA